MSEEPAGAPALFSEGDLCLLVDPKDRRHMLKLKDGQHFHHHRFGRLEHRHIIGRPIGFRVRGPQMGEAVCLRPSLEEYILKRLKRRTQIIYPKDLGTLILAADLAPGKRVLESGIGSGATSAVMLRFLGTKGRLISYERREEFAQLALETIADIEASFGPNQASHDVQIRDVYEGIDERRLDAVILDVPEPHRAVEFAAQALRPGGSLLCWLPTVLQVHTLVRNLQDCPDWAEIYTTETLVRPWEVNENSIRPAPRMVAHTGFLIRARRVEVVSFQREEAGPSSDLQAEQDQDPVPGQ